eukprot:449989-Rhodomonas_salina.1
MLSGHEQRLLAAIGCGSSYQASASSHGACGEGRARSQLARAALAHAPSPVDLLASQRTQAREPGDGVCDGCASMASCASLRSSLTCTAAATSPALSTSCSERSRTWSFPGSAPALARRSWLSSRLQAGCYWYRHTRGSVLRAVCCYALS